MQGFRDAVYREIAIKEFNEQDEKKLADYPIHSDYYDDPI